MWITLWVDMPSRLWRNVSKWIGGKPLRRLFDPHRNAPLLEPTAPTEAEWAALAPTVPGARPAVDNVIPVYGGRVETLRAIQRVLSARNATPCELVLVNDRSPDPVINARLDELERRG